MAISTALDKVRLVIGDTDSASYELSDDEINYFIGERGSNVLLAAADCCDALAAKFARAYDFSTDGQSFKRSQAAEAYRAQAKTLRARAQGVVTADSTRVDGYSEDVPNQQVQVTGTNPRRRYYGQEDRLP